MKQKLYLLLLAFLPIVALAESVPTGSGTKDDPFNAAAANAYVKSLDPDVVSDEVIYVKGKISYIKNNFTTRYGNATFYIADDWRNPEETFYVYRTLYLENRQFVDGDVGLFQGDEVIVCGKVIYYQGNIPETHEKDSYVYSVNGFVAQSVNIDGINYNLSDDKTAIVIRKTNGYGGTVIIPSTVSHNGEQFTVTSIGDLAFYNNTGVITISIPETVTTIESNVFEGCVDLSSIIIQDLSAWCRIVFKQPIDNPLYYAHNLFLNNVEVKDLVIPDGVTAINDFAFYGLSGISSLTIPEGVSTIGNAAFCGCSGLVTASLPNSVTVLGPGAFQGCSNLTTVNIPSGVSLIDGFLFYGCEKLSQITIPAGVTEVRNDIFNGCSNLTEVYCLSPSVPTTAPNAFDNYSLQSSTLYVPVAGYIDYSNTLPWSGFGTIKPIPGSEVATGDGTLSSPFNPKAANDYIKSLGPDGVSDKDIYIKGRICSIKNEFTSRYGNATFYISETGTDADEQLYAYRTLYVGNRNYLDGDTQIAVGDEVILCGKVKYYQGTTPETMEKSSFIYSLNGHTATVVEPKGSGTLADPYNASAANSFIKGLVPDAISSSDIVVKGKICAIVNEFTTQYGNATFYISDDGTTSGDLFYVYRTLHLGNKVYPEGGLQVQLGDEVVVCGKAIYYQGTTPETSENNSYVYSLNGVTYTEVDGLAYYVDTNKQTAEFTSSGYQYSGEVVIPSSIDYEGNSYAVTSISSQAFQGSESITAVTIPGSIVSIGEQAFEECNGLTTITTNIGEPFAIYNVFPANVLTSATLYVPYLKKAAYQATVGWRDFSNIVELPSGDVITVTAKSYEREYGEKNPTFEYDVTGGTADGNAVITCDATANSPAGTYPIIVSRGDVANTYATFVEGTLTITKAPLAVTAKSYTRKEGEDNPSFELTYTGWKLNETETVLNALPVATTDATKDSPAGDYVISVSGGSAQNYTFNYVNGILTIEETSGIATISGDGNPFDVYTMNGIKVRSKVTSLGGLPKGLYIVNGRKVSK